MVLLLCASMQIAVAQQPAEQAIDTLVQVEDIHITTIKQGLQLHNRAVAATLLREEQIEQRNLTELKQLSLVVPNFHMPDYGSRMTSSIYIRGMGTRIEQPAVGLNVDNIPYLSKDNFDFQLIDIERIEVLRGPQSTLYGRNTMGGVINIYTRSPLSYHGTRIAATYASGNSIRLQASTHQPLTSHTALSVGAHYLHSEGLFTNLYDQSDCDNEQSGGIRLRLQSRLNTRWQMDHTATFGMVRQGGYPYASLESGEINYNDPCAYRRTTFTHGMTLRYRTARWELSSVSSYQYSDDCMTLDQDFLPDSYFTLQQAKQDHALTEDLILRYKGAEHYKGLFGLFGFYRHRTMQAPVVFKQQGIEELILANANTSPDLQYNITATELPLDSRFRNPVYGVALYHESELHLGRWLLRAALRLDYEHNRLRYQSLSDVDYTLSINQASPIDVHLRIDDAHAKSLSFVELLPSFGVTYAIDNRSSLYASISRGYKAGGFNTQMFSDILQEKIKWRMVSGLDYDNPDVMAYEPEYSWNYEVGGHLATHDGMLQGDVALFWIDCRNQQLTVFPDGQTTGRMMTNAGRTRSRGVETSLRIIPHRNLNIDVAYGLTDARFLRYRTTVKSEEGTAVVADYRGRKIPYAPRHTLSTAIAWTIPTKGDVLQQVELCAALKGVGAIAWNEENSRIQSFYTLVDGSIALHFKRCSLTLWGRNLADKRYDVFYFKSIGNEFVQRGQPRTAGVKLAFQF